MKLDINNYPGSKRASGLYQFIINHIPERKFIIELFAGGGVITEKLVKNDCTAERFYCYEKSVQVFNQLREKFEYNYNVSLNNVDAIQHYFKVLNEYPKDYSNSFFYIDHPYLMTTRRRSNVDIYECEFSAKEHVALFDLIKKLNDVGAKIMVSHYPNDFYDEHLVTKMNFNTAETQSMTRGGVATEKIYFNYDISKLKLATTAFVGHGRQERQRIKRKKVRWRKALEKNAIARKTGYY
ncbi:MAG: DNA adenine methylase [Brumimicrobium sp.]|nr:DNA adenine methylase [Brumimicrobium sp.]